LKKEIKVGILGLVAIVVCYFGFTFLKGLDFLSTVEEYHVFFKDVQGLDSSNPVTYNGVNVGKVVSMAPDYDKDMIDVTLNINKKVKLTNNTVAILADNGLIGGKLIKLKIGKGKELSIGGTLSGQIETTLMQSVEGKIGPTLQNFDSLTINLNRIVKQFDQTGQALKILMASATQSSASINGLVANNSKNLNAITSNAAVLTQNLNTLTKSLDQQIKPILAKSGSFADSLNALQLGKTVGSLNNTINSLNNILAEVNAGKGTLGKLTSNDSLYINLDKTAASINYLLSDMKENPKRYVHFSLFGRKKN
jgi:phospholipid/cholesterol/gamma-HCH transport system substrate-binding protein